MKRKFLGRISISTTPEAEDAVAELLNEILGLPASSYHDHKTGVSMVTVYLQRKWNLPRPIRGRISAGLRRIRSCGLDISPGKIVMARVRWEDWAESWKRHFRPIEIGGSLLIKPSWSRRRARKGQAVVVLDPGLSFGTGHHPTTAFCLGEIAKRRTRGGTHSRQRTGLDGSARRPNLKPPSFLDLGTGSGILAIAAAKLGYSPVRAMDFDPEAVRVACANACTNRLRHKLKIRRGDVTKLPIRPRQRGQRYDLVCANLISPLLIAERRRIAGQLNPAGTLVLAGILKSEFTEVQKAYEALGWKLASSREEKEWRSGSFRFERQDCLNGKIAGGV
ncbi:MAG TPA: 50S ribosomal protein L11 methyltransferase [Verrucomicrobiae bacterium]|nr:50S ribosomal protein L11 methyltransferase [Verrucomicrobiae bacterium]